MSKLKFRFGAILILFLLVFSGAQSQGLGQKQSLRSNEEIDISTGDSDFYFVHITDTHVMNRIFDWKEVSKKRLRTVLDTVCSFEKKPAFIVITGDLTEWGGSRITGAMNCRAFTSCLYKESAYFYADANCTIPVFTTPGNHDYCYNRNLSNYHHIIESADRYTVRYDNVSLFFMNSGPSYYDELYNWFENIDGDGLYDYDIAWLTQRLENCSTNTTIVLMHHPAVNIRDKNGKMWDVLARNREAFITLCEQYNVEVVLAGHTHEARIFDGNETSYSANTSINCSLYPTLFVQTDDCKQGIHYRNVTIQGTHVWLERCVQINGSIAAEDNEPQALPLRYSQFWVTYMSRR
jgi:3',5'-cyclic AMP phosphodiesterase CpdA